jgi:uncharacterized YkwD family protein
MKKTLAIALASLITVSPMTALAQNIPMFKEAPFESYKVVKGDSFWFIAHRYGLDYQELMRLNPTVKPLNMQIGSNIQLKPAAGTPGNVAQPTGNFEAQVADLVNEERGKAGLKFLELRADLSKVAETKSQDMVSKGYFSHQSPTYGSPFDMLKQFGISYRTAGENIAQGQRTPGEVMDQWMQSPGHRKNILNPDFDSIGVGEVNKTWTQEFTGGR